VGRLPAAALGGDVGGLGAPAAVPGGLRREAEGRVAVALGAPDRSTGHRRTGPAARYILRGASGDIGAPGISPQGGVAPSSPGGRNQEQDISLSEAHPVEERKLVLTVDPKLVRYPFLRSSRDFLLSYPLDEVVQSLSKPILDQARYRLTLAKNNPNFDVQNVRRLGYQAYERRTRDTSNPEDVIEFYSYFVAVLASKNEPFLTLALARTEAARAKAFFVKEPPQQMIALLREAAGLELKVGFETERGGDVRTAITCPFEKYLEVTTEYELTREPRWRLVNTRLSGGLVYFTANDIMDLFAALVQGLMISGMRSLRSAPVPAFVQSLVDEFRPLIPRPPPRQQNQFDYIMRLLEHPITDGRHRIIWLILAPYFTTIKGMDEASAADAILAYIGDARYRQFIRYNVRRAMKSGLFPLSEQSIRQKHPDVAAVLPKGVLAK
jgi:Primase X